MKKVILSVLLFSIISINANALRICGSIEIGGGVSVDGCLGTGSDCTGQGVTVWVRVDGETYTGCAWFLRPVSRGKSTTISFKNLNLISDKNGNLIVSSVRLETDLKDVTEKKKAEIELNSKSNLLKTIASINKLLKDNKMTADSFKNNK